MAAAAGGGSRRPGNLRTGRVFPAATVDGAASALVYVFVCVRACMRARACVRARTRACE